MVVAVGTFFILMGLTPIAPTQNVVLTVLIVNGGLAILLILVIGWEIASLVLARRRRRAAARLHIRIVALFSVVAAAPAILVAVVASVTLDRGLDNWFSTSTRAIVDNSATIAKAFIDQQAQSLDRDIIGAQGRTASGRGACWSTIRTGSRPFSSTPPGPRPLRRVSGEERRLDRRRGGSGLAGPFSAAAALGDRAGQGRPEPAGADHARVDQHDRRHRRARRL